MTNATDGTRLVNRVEDVAPPDVRLAQPVVIVSPSPTPLPTRSRLTVPRVLVALVLVGFGLRVGALTNDRCLWIDEAMLALNLIERPVARLFEPLDWNQGAPVGFLLLAKASVTVFGPTELGLRFVPFIGSVLGLVAFAWVSRRLLPAAAAVLATGLFAVSPFLISYSAECKQYAIDAALTVGLFAVSAGLLRGERGVARYLALAVAGAIAVWFSHPAAFVLGGIGTALLAEAVVSRNRSWFVSAALTVGCWLVSFGVCYLVSLRQLGGNQYLLDYWNGHFLPLPPKSLGDIAWLLDHFFTFFAFPGGLGGTEIRAGGIAAVLFVVGVVGFWRDRWPLAVAVVLPGVFALLASGVHKYPFAGRLLLFLVPLMVLGVARGGWMIAAVLRPKLPIACWALLGVLVAAPTVESFQELRRPARFEQLEPVLDRVRGEWQAGDRMYVYYGARPAFLYYTRDGGFPTDAVMFGESARENRTEYREQLAKLHGQRRVWLVFSHRHKDEELIIRVYAEGLGRCVRAVDGNGAAAYLFDFSVPPGGDQVGAGVAGFGERIGAVRAGE